MSESHRVDKAEATQLRASGWTYRAIGEHFGVTEAAAWQAVNGRTSRVYHGPCACGCGEPRKGERFASLACYHRWIRSRPGVGVEWRQGQRRARVVIAPYLSLLRGAVVHHEDRDNRNNALSNLWVFASHAEHLSYHRGGKGRPIWRGDSLVAGEHRDQT